MTLPFGDYKNQELTGLAFTRRDLKEMVDAAKKNNLRSSYKFKNVTFINCAFYSIDFADYFSFESGISFIGCHFDDCGMSSGDWVDDVDFTTFAFTSCELSKCCVNGLSLRALHFEASDVSSCIINQLDVEKLFVFDGNNVDGSLFNTIYLREVGTFSFRSNYISESVFSDIQSREDKIIQNEFNCCSLKNTMLKQPRNRYFDTVVI